MNGFPTFIFMSCSESEQLSRAQLTRNERNCFLDSCDIPWCYCFTHTRLGKFLKLQSSSSQLKFHHNKTMAIHVNILVLCFIVIACVECRPPRDPQPPVWPASYMAKGIINLPYAEIGEPFEAWYDGPNQRSRIDYYSGR